MLPPLRTLPFPLLLDEAWAITRRRFRALFLPLLAAFAPVALLLHGGMGWWNVQLLETADPASACGVFLGFGCGMLLVMVGFFLVYGTMLVAATEAVAGLPVAVGRSLRTYLRPAIWGTDLLAWILIGLGWMACLAPGLLLQVAWGLRVPVMVLERRYGFEAMSRSWQLLAHNPQGGLRHHPMVKMGLLLLLGLLLAWAVSLVVQAPAAIVNQVLMFREISGGQAAADPAALMRSTLWLSIPAGLIASFAQLAVQLYVDVAVAALTLDQRRRREGDDLEAELDRLALRPGAAR